MSLSAWTTKQDITINGTYIATTISNCPVVLTQSAFDSSFITNMKSDGTDLRFSSDSDGLIELPREIQYFDQVGGNLIVHVKVDSFTASTNKTIYAWCGNADAIEPAPRDTSGYQMVWNDVYGGKSYYGVVHLQKGPDSGTLFVSDPGFKSGFESSGNWTNINNSGNIVVGTVAGPLTGQATWELADTFNIINLESIDTQSSNSTVAFYLEFWMYHTSYPSSNGPIFVGDFNRFLKFESQGKVKFGDSGNASTANAPLSAWYQRAMMRDAAGNVTFALNGVTDGTTSTTQDIENMNRIFQDRNNNGTGFSGVQIAWMRLTRGDTLGTAHLQTQYNAVVNAALFATAGTVTITPVGYTLTLVGLKIDSDVKIYDATTNDELASTNSSTTSFTWNFTHTVDFNVNIYIQHLDYVYIRLKNFTVTASNNNIPIDQVFDRYYIS